MSTAHSQTQGPQTLRETIAAEAEAMFQSLRPELAERCRREYVSAATEVELRMRGIRPLAAGEAKEHPANSSSTADTTPKRSLPSVTRKLQPGSSLLAPLTVPDVQSAISRIGIQFGLAAISETQQIAIAQTLIAEDWTAGELSEAIMAIPADAELGRQIGYDQTVTPALFAMARKHFRVMRGRLHEYDAVRQMAEDRRRPLHEIAEPVNIEVPGLDGSDPYLITKWALK